MQAELVACATCSDEVKWFSNIMKENIDVFGEQATNAIPIMVDNEAALRVANHPSTTPKSKFVALREFRIRDYQEEGICKPLWIPGTLNIADGFTKLLGTILFSQFARLLGMSPVDKNLQEETNTLACFWLMANKDIEYGHYDINFHYPNNKYFFIFE